MSCLSNADRDPETSSAKPKHHHRSGQTPTQTLRPRILRNLSPNLHRPLRPRRPRRPCVWRPNPDRRPRGDVRLNRAKLPPPPASSGLGRFPRPTTSSGRKLGSYHRRLFVSGLRHPPWEEGTHKLSLQLLRNNRNVPIQKCKITGKQKGHLHQRHD